MICASNKHLLKSEAYLVPCQTFKMEFLQKTKKKNDCFNPITTFKKSSILDI